jgi:D-alanine-D-alanine ligase-like ATP-grasp enzyme
MKRVGILRGGTGENYDSSLKEGGNLIAHIFEHLSEDWKPVDILVDLEGKWHLAGIPILPAELGDKVDIVWNTSEPSFSQVIKSLQLPHLGISSLSSLLANNQDALREHVKEIGLKMPRSIVLPVYQTDFDGPKELYAVKKAKEIHNKFPAPWMVKSFTPDSSMGIHLAKTFPELVRSIEDGVAHNKSILVEEFITGKVASIHTLPGFRNEALYTFPLGASFGNFSKVEKDQLTNIAKRLHQHLDAGHYLKSDYVLAPKGSIYLINIDLAPDLKPESHLSQVAESVGAKVHHIVKHILNKAL